MLSYVVICLQKSIKWSIPYRIYISPKFITYLCVCVSYQSSGVQTVSLIIISVDVMCDMPAVLLLYLYQLLVLRPVY
jgi:hypothetical protein